MIQIFYTINPHINNLSMDRLKSDFRYCLQKYYRKTLGQRYYKHKDKQYDIGIFPEIGDREIKEPHLHILVDLPLNELKRFYNIISSNMHKIYPSLTDKIKVGDNSANLWKYCTKEDKGLIVKSDLLEK